MTDKTKADELLNTGPEAAIELDESEIDQVAGGVHKNKTVTSSKNAEAIKGLL